MTYVKRLKLKGFKTFNSPTTIIFEKGFNSIIGANGSGKSNIFDAFCFVLGRLSTKSLRADKLGNLVFNGGKNLKPAKEAEVSIFLSNENKEFLDADLDEVKITRVVSREGSSKYYINNNRATRTDVINFLAKANIDPDGYNIILQGDINKVVNMSSFERREIIEEISNISGYEDKREKALKKLQNVENDLKDADLLMEEKTKYLKELKHEKELADKYNVYKDELNKNSILLFNLKLRRNEDLISKKEIEFEKNEEKVKKIKDDLDKKDEEIKKIETKIKDLEKEIELDSQKGFIEISNKITELKNEIKNKEEKKSEFKKNLTELKNRDEEISKNIKANLVKINGEREELKKLINEKNKLKDELEKINKKLEKEKNTSSKSFDKLNEIDKKIEELQTTIQEYEKLKQENLIEIEKIKSKLELYEEKKEEKNKKIKENKEKFNQLKKYREDIKKLTLKLSKLRNEHSENIAKLTNLKKEYNELIEERDKLKILLDSSKNVINTNRALKEILNFKNNDSNIYGSVMDLISVPSKYSLAIETIVGKNAFNVVVRDEDTAIKYIQYLKDNRIGTLTFLPLNKINIRTNLDETILNSKGVINFAKNLVSFDKKFENVVNLILGDTLIIEDIKFSKSIGIGKFRMVSLDGDYVSKTGSLTGGFNKRRAQLNLFRDDKKEEKLNELESKISNLLETIDFLKDVVEEKEKEIEKLRYEKNDLELEVSKLEKLLSLDSNDEEIDRNLNELNDGLKIFESELNNNEKKLKKYFDELNKLQKEREKIKQENFGNSENKSLANLETKKEELQNKLFGIENKINETELKLNDVLILENENLKKIKIEIKESIEKLTKNISGFTEEISKNKKLLSEYLVKERELSKNYKEIIKKREELRKKKESLEKDYKEIYEKFEKVKEKSTELRLNLEEYKSLNVTIKRDYDEFLTQFKIEFTEKLKDENENDDEEINDDLIRKKLNEYLGKIMDDLNKNNLLIKDLQNKVNSLKIKISSFGGINLKAVKLYNKLKKEFDELLAKRENLNKEKKEILKFIEEIDKKKKERFLESFNLLQKHFRDYYKKLYGKGEVELIIEDKENLFQSGVTIVIHLTEKVKIDIKSLSGGEKSLTALAFIFSIQEFNPSSFYLFDEVDAALDILNAEKLGELIKKNSDKAQYIVVSHSEYVVKSADYLYGVSLDKNKTSQIVSLKLNETESYLN